ncbi:MAG: helix-turn-helix transcriptional regulator [Acidobacteriota bacterium]
MIYKDSKHADDLLGALPHALRILRERAGYRSLRPAAERIRSRTGASLSKATLSEWERGTRPVTDSLIFFLIGLGYDFCDLQQALDEQARTVQSSSLQHSDKDAGSG